jgi:hypothetical protein
MDIATLKRWQGRVDPGFVFPALPEGRTLLGVVFTGFLRAPVDSVYRFECDLRPGIGRFFVGGKQVVDNETSSYRREGRIGLQAGLHPVRLEIWRPHYHRLPTPFEPKIGWAYRGKGMHDIPEEALFRDRRQP